MKSLTECRECGFNLLNSDYFLVLKAIKPKGSPQRWATDYIVCEDCYDIDKHKRTDKY